MKMWKKIISVILLICLTGCAKIHWNYEIDRQGNIDGSIDVLVLATLLDGYDNNIELPQGSSIITDGDYQGYSIPLDQQLKDELASYITIENNILTFEMPNDENNQFLNNFLASFSNSNIKFDELSSDDLEITMDFSIPGKILENNATSIIDGKLHYDLLNFNEDSIYFSCELGMNPMIIYALCGIGIVVCFGLIGWIAYYFIKKKRNRK